MSRARSLAQALYERVPATRSTLHLVNNALHPPRFSGWGMTTQHASAWEDDHDWAHFRAALEHVRRGFEHGLREDTGITAGTVDILRWRHWYVAFAVRYACTPRPSGRLGLVECGVGDGLTAFFAGTEADHLGVDFTLDCYDTWAPVAVDDGIRSYDDLSLERTRRNLARFGDRVRYHPGLLPGTLDASAPASVAYLSIDLNAAEPTIAALEFFLPRLSPRGVVLFDDYGFAGYEPTKAAVDAFFAGRAGALMKLPTGQAIWFAG